MSRTTGPQKIERVLRFLIALRDDDLAGPLVGAGFTEADWKEGWSLLRACGPASLEGVRPPGQNGHARSRQALVEWEKRYVRLVEPAIARRWPHLHQFLYAKLGLGLEREVSLVVTRFLDRVDELPKKKNGADALALLRARGLTELVAKEARAHVAVVQAFAEAKKPARPDYEIAEKEAWAWYLEWSAVARATVRDGRVLHRLGFGAKRGSEAPAAQPG